MSPDHPWKVVLIVEDDSDGQAVKTLAGKLRLPIQVDWLPAGGVGNIKRKGESLIALARERVSDGRGCVAVLLDQEGKDANCEEPHLTIRQICRREDVPLLLAVEALEAWFLADAGCAKWLGCKRPRNADKIPNPKKVIGRAYFRKVRRAYTRRARRILAQKADGSAPEHSPSLREAVAYLKQSPCKIPAE